jgi:hypothetical protein
MPQKQALHHDIREVAKEQILEGFHVEDHRHFI